MFPKHFMIFMVAVSLRAQPEVTLPQSVDSPRPLADLKMSLQARFGSPITYEDPLWEWDGDITMAGGDKVPKYLRFVIPGEIDAEASLPDVLQRALSAYHDQTAGPRYRVISSALGLHLIPSEVRDSTGTLVAPKNILDSPITVDVQSRSPSGHLAALQAAVATATGVALRYGIKEGDGPFDHYFGAEDNKLTWGANNVAARGALVDLLMKSATTYSWEVRCQGLNPASQRLCVLSVGGVAVATHDPENPTKVLQFDRCTRCPPLANGR